MTLILLDDDGNFYCYYLRLLINIVVNLLKRLKIEMFKEDKLM